MSIRRDIMEKEIKSMHKALHDNYPHHIDFISLDDEQVEAMFNQYVEQVEALKKNKADAEEEEAWREYQQQQKQQAKPTLSMFLNNRGMR